MTQPDLNPVNIRAELKGGFALRVLSLSAERSAACGAWRVALSVAVVSLLLGVALLLGVGLLLEVDLLLEVGLLPAVGLVLEIGLLPAVGLVLDAVVRDGGRAIRYIYYKPE